MSIDFIDNILSNNFNMELVSINYVFDLSNITILLGLTKKILNNDKKILFISDDKEQLPDKIINNEQLILINNVDDIENKIRDIKPDIVLISNIQTYNEELIDLLHRVTVNTNVPVIVTNQLSTDYVDKSDLSIEDLRFTNNYIYSLVTHCDKFIVLYDKDITKYEVLKDRYGWNLYNPR